MLKLRDIISIGLTTLPFILGSCDDAGKKVTLEGTVVPESEVYIEATPGGGCDAPLASKYSFGLDTDHGRKSIQVKDGKQINPSGFGSENITKESIDALIYDNSKVTLLNINEKYLKRQVIVVETTNIEVK